MITPTVNHIVAVMKSKGYRVFENDTKPYNLNIVAIRNNYDLNSNTYNDLLIVFYRYNGYWEKYTFACTTDPGLYYRLNPINKLGTAILAPNQYNDMLCIGLHQGKYEALVQKSECTVIRDFNKDSIINIKPDDFINNVDCRIEGTSKVCYHYNIAGNVIFITETGIFGINIHDQRFNNNNKVDKYSAGCTVIRYTKDFNILMGLCKESLKYFKNSFTYTLLNEIDFE
jgi:hypothetical protein